MPLQVNFTNEADETFDDIGNQYKKGGANVSVIRLEKEFMK